MKLNLFDSHVHTSHSHDGQSTMEEVCAQAVSRGVMGVAFTDHYECDIPEQRLGVRDALAELPRFRQQYQGRLRLGRGIELGQGHLYPEMAEEILGSEEFDLVLGSVHTYSPGVDIGAINFNKPEVKVSDILEKYFRDCYDMTVWGRFDVMAHLGYPERYIWGKYRIPVSFAPYEDIIQATLKLLVETGKGLEVNTSGYRQGLGKTIPILAILKRYYQLGGRIVTLGSDAHRAEDLAADFEVAMDILTGIGFEYFAFYRERQPVMLKLI